MQPTEAAARRIFINYRRGDSQAAAGRLYDQLLGRFGRSEVFMDVDAIEPGIDFVNMLDEQVATCSAFIAVIGPSWLEATDRDGKRRLDNPTDYVRVEIESALKRDVRVIPVLVDGAAMPQAADLPASLAPLARRNAVELAHHRFSSDCEGLAYSIERAIRVPAPPPLPGQAALPPPPPLHAGGGPRLSWPQVFFSFTGRISRKQFAIGMLCTVAVFLAAFIAILLIVEGGNPLGTSSASGTKLMEDRVGRLFEFLVFWPSWALILKRLHDLGHGWKVVWVFVGLDLLSVVLDVLGQDTVSTNLALIYVGLLCMLAVIKGMPGPNRYGPDPLARA